MTFTHLDEHGSARMVNVNKKAITLRQATARALISGIETPPYDACEFAARSGVQNTSALIPLCHPIPLGDIEVAFQHTDDRLTIDVTVNALWRTGVEMEALTGASQAALTAVTSAGATNAQIETVVLLEKSGGRSGRWGALAAADELNNTDDNRNNPDRSEHRQSARGVIKR